MSSKRVNAVLRALGLALALLICHTPAAFADGDEADKRDRRAQLLERWKKLSPEKRAELKRVFQERVKTLSSQDRKRLRKLAQGSELKDKRRAKHAEAKRRFMRRFVGKLSKAERGRLANMEPSERREALRALLGKHRQRSAQRTFALLPPDRQRELREQLQGLEPGERYRRVRKVVQEHMRERIRELVESDAPLEQKRAQLEALLRNLPKPMAQRLKQQLERRLRGGEGQGPRRGGARPEGDAPRRGGARPEGERPQGPRRGQRKRQR